MTLTAGALSKGADDSAARVRDPLTGFAMRLFEDSLSSAVIRNPGHSLALCDGAALAGDSTLVQGQIVDNFENIIEGAHHVRYHLGIRGCGG
jgi:hypothetical protein